MVIVGKGVIADNSVPPGLDGRETLVGLQSESASGAIKYTQALSALLEGEVYSSVFVMESDASDYVEVSGYVADDVTLARLQDEVAHINARISINVYSLEQIQRSAQLVLNHLGLVAEQIKTGEGPGYYIAVIDGDFMEAWESAQRLLLSDIPGLQGWDFEVKTTLTPLERLKQLTANLGFEHRLSYSETDDAIQIIGRLNSVEEKELNQTMQKFRERVGESPLVEYLPPKNSERVLSLNDVGIAGVRTGKAPYVTHQNGNRYLLGARLPNGITLQDIREGEIHILHRGVERIIRYEKNNLQLTDVNNSASRYE
nr:type III secretion system inner membrane ring subunit SctD [Marinibactrum halimedae]